MKVLVVDNDLGRVDTLLLFYSAQEVFAASDGHHANALLSRHEPDLVSLDFDLDNGTTDSVAEDIALLSCFRPLVIIHSENPAGVRSLQKILPDATSLPLSRLSEKSQLMSRLKRLLSHPLESEELPVLRLLLRAISSTAGKQARKAKL